MAPTKDRNGAFLAVAVAGNEWLLKVRFRPFQSRPADDRLWHLREDQIGWDDVSWPMFSGPGNHTIDA